MFSITLNYRYDCIYYPIPYWLWSCFFLFLFLFFQISTALTSWYGILQLVCMWLLLLLTLIPPRKKPGCYKNRISAIAPLTTACLPGSVHAFLLCQILYVSHAWALISLHWLLHLASTLQSNLDFFGPKPSSSRSLCVSVPVSVSVSVSVCLSIHLYLSLSFSQVE